ncbi:MAG: hypothetical protein J3K34DRAFT_406669 [Monoraphidium minutum]|nr:MAG: hypothetical protein J3K34DRAFT_406669 [Monoraphidium minutum]
MIASRSSNMAVRASRARSTSVVCKASGMDRVKAVAASVAATAALLAAPAPAPAQVKFLNVDSGASVSSPVHLELGVRGLDVFPASEGLIPGTGHFHVVVDRAADDKLGEGDVIPFDATHLHYGKGQVSVDVPLTPGKHTLTLQFANALHESFGPDERQEITVTVK